MASPKIKNDEKPDDRKLWLDALQAFSSQADTVRIVSGWPDDIEFFDIIHSIQENFENTPSQTLETLAKNLNDLPNLLTLALCGLQSFNFSFPAISMDDIKTVTAAACLGEIPNECKYHNNRHFRKVLLQTLRLIHVHNDIYKDTERALTEKEVILLMIAGSIHDLGHDGLGNTVQGIHKPNRLELQSFLLAEPYLKTAGLNKPEDLDTLKIMILCTDVSPLNSKNNPVNQAKAAYHHHFLETQNLKLELHDSLKRLETDPKLAMMSLLLHEADIATSAGIDYETTKQETVAFRKEIEKNDACPEHILDFMNYVCKRQFLTEAGQHLFGANMARIYALAEADFKAGNLMYE